MKKIVAGLLLVCMLISLCACGKSKEAKTADDLILAIGEVDLDSEANVLAAVAYYNSLTQEQKAEVENYTILENAVQKLEVLQAEAIVAQAISLYEQGEFEDALIAFKELEQTDEIKEYIRKASFNILAEQIFKNGTEGSVYGVGDGESYYTEVPGSEIVLSVVPTANGFESISFGLMPAEPRGILSAENYLLTLYEEKNQFNYYYMFIFGASSYSWNGEAACGEYTREATIDFEVSLMPETSVWQLSTTEEESKLGKRDECNDFLDEVAMLLRKIDCGVSLKDLGFYAYE